MTNGSRAGFRVTSAVTDGIERVSVLPDGPCRDTPILFVHSMWHAAWCWRPWQERLAARGWESHAISLPGHGASPATRPVRWSTMGFYLDVLRREIE